MSTVTHRTLEKVHALRDPILKRFIVLRHEQRDWSERTLIDNEQVLRRYDTWLFARGLSFTETDEDDFLVYWRDLKETYATATANQHLVKIRAVYSWALRKRGIDCSFDPTMEIKRLRDDTYHQAEIYSSADLKAIRDAIITEWEELVYHLLVYTGCRREEIVNLEWANVDWGSSIIRVFGKGRKWREVPIHPVLMEILEQHYREDRRHLVNSQWNRQMTVETFRHTFNKLKDRVDLPEFKRPFHSFRATVNESLAINGVELLMRKRIMGHADGNEVNNVYRQVTPEQLNAAILRLYADVSINRG